MRRFFALKPLILLTATALTAACGGGGGGGGSTDSGTGLNESSCDLQYSAATAAGAVGTDPRLADQWHLSNTGQFGGISGNDNRVFEAWNTTRGAQIQVAVVDDAVEVTHEDLVANVTAGKSYNYRSQRRGSSFPLPCSSSQSHGTAVAGLITARDNNAKGVAGVAPRANLVGFNALATSLDSDIADALNRELAIVDVYNNSWGSPDNGQLNPAESSFVRAIDNGIRNGRNGKGTIYTFPGGNGGCYGVNADTQACYSDNSNYDGYVNKLGLITTCAVDNMGKQPAYGERGANFLVCGSSSNNRAGITTTALLNDYRSNFSGTSASTPIVAGVAALMLAANPQLTWRDVQLILASTARKNDEFDAEWTTNFGLNFNPKYGFGTANAAAAVAAATSWTSVGGSESLKTCGPFVSNPNRPLPDPAPAITTIEDSITVTGCAISKIEFVEIRLTTDHTYNGDLRVNLSSPNGLISELADDRLCSPAGAGDSCGSYDDWPFGSVRHMGEPADGVWTMGVADAILIGDDQGTFKRWALTFYGS